MSAILPGLATVFAPAGAAAGAGAAAAGAAGAGAAAAAGGVAAAGMAGSGMGLIGSILSGVGQGLFARAEMRAEERQQRRMEERREARYEGAGQAARFWSDDEEDATITNEGAEYQRADPTEPLDRPGNETGQAGERFRRPAAPGGNQRIRNRYNPQSGRIEQVQGGA